MSSEVLCLSLLWCSPVGWQGSGRTAVNPVERRGCKSVRSAVFSRQTTTPHAPSTINTATTTGLRLADPATDTPVRPSGELDRGHRYAGWTGIKTQTGKWKTIFGQFGFLRELLIFGLKTKRFYFRETSNVLNTNNTFSELYSWLVWQAIKDIMRYLLLLLTVNQG